MFSGVYFQRLFEASIKSDFPHVTENRLKKLKGQSSDVTSRDMLRSLSQAKKECWDRFLHDAQTSELFQGGDMDDRSDIIFLQTYFIFKD